MRISFRGRLAAASTVRRDIDALCNRVAMTDTFGYNARGEVTAANVSGVPAAYGYDEIGNSTSWTVNRLNQYTQFTYDLDGKMTQCGDWAYTYDSANRLKAISSNGVLLVTNFYDAKSRRVKKVTSDATATFFYDGWNLIEERVTYTNGTASTIRYYWGKDLSGTLQDAGGVGGLLYLTVDGAIHIPCYDNNGNVTCYLDANGNAVARYVYDAFGNILSMSGPLADAFRFRFSTKYFDVETGLYYYGYRFYSPALMRWLTRDPIGERGGLNLYGFCGNDPLEVVDPTGLKCTVGTFNVRSIAISATPQWIRADINSLERDSATLLDALEGAGLASSAVSLATSHGMSALMLNLADIAAAGSVSPDVGILSRAVMELLGKLRRQGPLRLDGTLKWDRCECVDGKTKWVRQADITDSDEVDLGSIGIEVLYAQEFNRKYKEVERALIKSMYKQLRK